MVGFAIKQAIVKHQNGMCQNNNCKKKIVEKVVSQIEYMCLLFYLSPSVCVCLLWSFALDTALHDFFPFIGYVCACVSFFSPLFRLANYIISCLLLSCIRFIEKRYYWFVNPMYIIMENSPENEPFYCLIFSVFFFLSFAVVLHVYFIIPFLFTL